MNALTLTHAASMTSKEIAELLEKRHDKVKQSIERLANQEVIAQPPMGDGPKSANGVVEQVYIFDAAHKRDTYVVVAQLSPEFTARVVDRWQELEQPKSTGDALVQMALAYREHEQRIMSLEAQQATTAAQIKALVDGEGFFTVVGYANRLGVRISEQEAARLGKAASHICKLHGIQRGEAPHPRYGKSFTYPEETLAQVFAAEGREAA